MRTPAAPVQAPTDIAVYQRLLEQGLITPEQYEAMRVKLLGQ